MVLGAFSTCEPHPFWDHSLVPQLHLNISSNGGDYLLETNAQGFRHPRDIQNPKPPEVYRVFVLGDSFTEGLTPGPTVVDWIEKKLRRDYPGIHFEVINAGVSSQSLIPYIVRLRRQIFSFSPDLIIVNIDNTDVTDDLRLLPAVEFDKTGTPVRVLQKLPRYHAMKAWVNGAQSQFLIEGGRYFLLSRLAWIIFFRLKDFEKENGIRYIDPAEREILQDYTWIKKKKLTSDEKKLLLKWSALTEILIRVCKEQKIPIFLDTYPHPDQFRPEGGRHLSEVLEKIAQEADVPYFDAYDAIKKNDNNIGALYLKEDIHFNESGNQKWGEALGEFVSRKASSLLSFRS